MRRTLLVPATVAVWLLAASLSHAVPDFSEPTAIDEPVYSAATARATGLDVTSLDGQRAVVWIRDFSTILGLRVGADGGPLDDTPRVLRTTDTVASVRLASHDSGYVMVWEEGTNSDSTVFSLPLDAELNPTGQRRALSRPNQQSDDPEIAWNGSTFLVSWYARRGASEEIRALRLGTNGAPLANEPTTVWEQGSSVGSPAVGTNGDDFLVAWPDDWDDSRLLAARMGADGSVQSADPIKIATNAAMAIEPTIASDGSNYFVSWRRRTEDGDGIFGAILDAQASSATVVDEVQIDRSSYGQREPVVVWSGQEYVVGWDQRENVSTLDSTVMLQRVTRSGEVFDQAPIELSAGPSPGSSTPRLTANQNNIYGLWRGVRLGNPVVFGSRLDRELSRLDGEGRLLSAMPNAQMEADLAASHEGFLLVWQDNRNEQTGFDILAMRFDRAGTRLDDEPFVICDAPGRQITPTVASIGDEYVVIWSDHRGDELRLYGTRVRASDGRVRSRGEPLTLGTRPQEAPQLATNGDNYMVTWAEPSPGSTGERSVFVKDMSGAEDASLTPGSKAMVARNVTRYTDPAVAADGDGYLVVWNQPHASGFRIYGAQVSSDGEPANTAPQAIVESEAYAPKLVSTGSALTLAWRGDLAPEHNIYVARLDDFDIGEQTRLGGADTNDFGHAIDYSGAEYIALWSRPQPDRNGGQLFGASLDQDLAPLNDSTGVKVDDAFAPTLSILDDGRAMAAWSRAPRSLAQTPRLYVSAFELEREVDPNPNAGDVADASDVDTGSPTSPDVDVWQSGDATSSCSCTTVRGTSDEQDGRLLVAMCLLFAAHFGRTTFMRA